jgi:hypothetical protein
MQQVHTHLSVFYDGQFFTALFERWDAEGYRVYRRVFATEPSSPEIWSMVLAEKPSYGPPSPSVPPDMAQGNPKRKQREAARLIRTPVQSTKAQQALQAMRETHKKEVRTNVTLKRKQREDALFQMRAEKKKKKHRGR